MNRRLHSVSCPPITSLPSESTIQIQGDLKLSMQKKRHDVGSFRCWMYVLLRWLHSENLIYVIKNSAINIYRYGNMLISVYIANCLLLWGSSMTERFHTVASWAKRNEPVFFLFSFHKNNETLVFTKDFKIFFQRKALKMFSVTLWTNFILSLVLLTPNAHRQTGKYY